MTGGDDDQEQSKQNYSIGVSNTQRAIPLSDLTNMSMHSIMVIGDTDQSSLNISVDVHDLYPSIVTAIDVNTKQQPKKMICFDEASFYPMEAILTLKLS